MTSEIACGHDSPHSCPDSCDISEEVTELQGKFASPSDLENELNRISNISYYDRGRRDFVESLFEDYIDLLQDSDAFDEIFSLEQSLLTSDGLIEAVENADRRHPGMASAAFFDILMSGLYAQYSARDGNWIYCEGHDDEDPIIFLSSFNSCPRCSTKHGAHQGVPEKNKPKPGTIGALAEKSLLFILMEVYFQSDEYGDIARAKSNDIDAFIYDDDYFGFCEIKASPLVLFPLVTTYDEGYDHHSIVSDPDIESVSLFLPNEDNIPVGDPEDTSFPFDELENQLSEQETLDRLLSTWKRLYESYAKEDGPERAITCGSGVNIENYDEENHNAKNVDDGKTQPGIDRTDDIKKGLAQVFGYHIDFRQHCANKRLKTVLISNILPVHRLDYLLNADGVIFGNVNTADETEDNIILNKSDISDLYDAVLCLTESHCRDESLEEMTKYDAFEEAIRNE